jgi:DNA-binding transcriptional LysR family regulator
VSLPVRDRELIVTPFFRDELVAIAPPEAAWRRMRALEAPTLASHPLILFEAGATLRRIIDGWFHRAGAVPRSPMELGNTEAIKKLVEAGLGLSVTSWFSVKSEVRAGALTAIRLTPPLERQIGLVRRRDKPRTPALDAFTAALEHLRRSLETRRPRRA